MNRTAMIATTVALMEAHVSPWNFDLPSKVK